MSTSFRYIRPLFKAGKASSRWFSYIGLGIGVLLLLCSLQMFINIQQLLEENIGREDGADYISIVKTITNETMGQEEKNAFTMQEVRELEQQAFVQGVSPLLSNQFRVQLSAGSIIPFQTDLFIETLDNEFIDTVPDSFRWTMGDIDVPIILSSDFLEIYNVFAPGQGLPQVSQETASGIPIILTCEGNGRRNSFRGRVVAFSDRVNSVLVPKSFLQWANSTFGAGQAVNANRLFIKTTDANNADLLNFLDQKNYRVNKDKVKFGRVKQVLQGVFTGLGVFGILVVILALLLFSFYLQLMIARSRDNLQLLLTLGYSPKWLTAKVSSRFIPVYIVIVLGALAVAQILQAWFHQATMFRKSDMTAYLHWAVLLTALVLIALSLMTNYRMVRGLIRKIGLSGH